MQTYDEREPDMTLPATEDQFDDLYQDVDIDEQIARLQAEEDAAQKPKAEPKPPPRAPWEATPVDPAQQWIDSAPDLNEAIRRGEEVRKYRVAELEGFPEPEAISDEAREAARKALQDPDQLSKLTPRQTWETAQRAQGIVPDPYSEDAPPLSPEEVAAVDAGEQARVSAVVEALPPDASPDQRLSAIVSELGADAAGRQALRDQAADTPVWQRLPEPPLPDEDE